MSPELGTSLHDRRYAIPLESVGRLALFLLILLALIEPLTTITVPVGDPELTGEGNAVRQVAYMLIFGLALLSAGVLNAQARLRVLPVSMFLMLAWCALSVGWALNPAVSARRFLLTAVVTYSVFLLVETVGYETCVKIVRILLLSLLVANFLAVLGWHDQAVHQEAIDGDPSVVGAWYGVLIQKNLAGAACALTVIFFALGAKRIGALQRVCIVLAAAFFLFMTESKTSMAWLGASLALGWLSIPYRLRHRSILLWALLLAAACAGAAVYQYWGAIAGIFDSEDALTGRVQIWPLLVEFWKEHWLLGSGFGSFWNIGHPSPIEAYTDGWIAGITSGHNGYLDILVQTGVPGLALAIVATIVAPVCHLLGREIQNPSRRALLLALVCFAVGHNLTESSIFNRDSTINVFLMMAVALINLESRRRPDAEAAS